MNEYLPRSYSDHLQLYGFEFLPPQGKHLQKAAVCSLPTLEEKKPARKTEVLDRYIFIHSASHPAKPCLASTAIIHSLK